MPPGLLHSNSLIALLPHVRLLGLFADRPGYGRLRTGISLACMAPALTPRRRVLAVFQDSGVARRQVGHLHSTKDKTGNYRLQRAEYTAHKVSCNSHSLRSVGRHLDPQLSLKRVCPRHPRHAVHNSTVVTTCTYHSTRGLHSAGAHPVDRGCTLLRAQRTLRAASISAHGSTLSTSGLFMRSPCLPRNTSTFMSGCNGCTAAESGTFSATFLIVVTAPTTIPA